MSNRIAALRQRQAEILDELEVIAEPLDDQGEAREWTDEDQKLWNEKEAELKKVTDDIQRAERVQQMKMERAVPAERSTLPAQAKDQKTKGTDFARCVRAMAAAKGTSIVAAQWAEQQNWDNKTEIAKALGSSTAAGGGFLVPVEYSTEIIELLRARTVVMAANPVIMPMAGTLEIPRITAGASGSYIGENTNIGKEQQTFGNLKATAKKLASLVPISNDLIRNSNPQVDAVVRDDMVAGMSVTADAAMIRSVGSENEPKGLYYWANSGNLTASAGTSATNIETDVRTAQLGLLNNNVRMLRPAWLMAPRSRLHLEDLRDANGNLIYPSVGNSRTLKTYPIFDTTSIPINLGGSSNATELYFVDMMDVVVAEETGIEIAVSDTAAYHDGSNVIAAFSQDQTVIRAIIRHDLVVRHDRSVSVIHTITWGA